MADNDFSGFANAPLETKGKNKGKPLDFRDVEGYVDETEAGKTAESSRRTPSSIVQFKTDDTSTNGSPMATVPAPAEIAPVVGDGEPDPSGESTSADDNPTAAQTS